MTDKVQLQGQIKKWTSINPLNTNEWMTEVANTEGLNLEKGIIFPGVTFYKLVGSDFTPKSYRIFLRDGSWMFEWEGEEPQTFAKALNDTIYVDKGLTIDEFQVPSQASEPSLGGRRRRRRTRKTRKGRKSRKNRRSKRRRSRH
jgi:hypothetical protein